jgi:hypothetical protein
VGAPAQLLLADIVPWGWGPQGGMDSLMPRLCCTAVPSLPACLPACLPIKLMLLLGGAAGVRRSCAPGPTSYPWSHLPPAVTAVSWVCGRLCLAVMHRLPTCPAADTSRAAAGVYSHDVMPAAAAAAFGSSATTTCPPNHCTVLTPCTSPVPPACRRTEAVHWRHAHHCHSGRHPGHLQGLWQGEPLPLPGCFAPAVHCPVLHCLPPAGGALMRCFSHNMTGLPSFLFPLAARC